MRKSCTVVAALLAAAAPFAAAQSKSPDATFDKEGRPKDPAFFPVAVWLQAPHNAQRYREIGINLYVGLFGGPTEAQLTALRDAKMPVICQQNEVGLHWKGAPIVGWMHGDEPDNAQAKEGGGYGPPVAPKEIVAGYVDMKKADKTRPVLLNLGQGAAWDGWIGRGVRTNHPEDYRDYVEGCDIASFDIYPVTHDHRDVKGHLEFVARGVQRLREGGRGKPVWACIETGHVSSKDTRPTPQQVVDEVWIAIASGAAGIVYFCHEFAPAFVEAGLLAHEDVRAAVAELDAELAELAPVLNAAVLDDAVKLRGDDAERFAVRAHRDGATLHVFVASLSPDEGELKLTVKGQRVGAAAWRGDEGKEQKQRLKDGGLTTQLRGYGHLHLRITR
ncbi:MAG: beta-galactosidase [Planctomycetes bacterium]|nr:beta-galactosidase [Planctomycetota bacterium]